MDPDRLLTETLRSAPWGAQVARVLAAGLAAVDPFAAVERTLTRQGGRLYAAGREVPLDAFERVLVIGAGKAGLPMARAVVGVLGERVAGGVVIVKEGHAEGHPAVGPVQIIQAGHPLPDERGLEGTRRIADLLAGAGGRDLVLCLISGGGSALLTMPSPGLNLADLRALTDQLLASGASIDEINTLRKHLDRVKGGGLARMAAPAQVITLILSDVVGNPLDIIASGPTVPDPATFADARRVLARYDLASRVPPALVRLLAEGARGDVPETPKPGDPLFDRVDNLLVGSNGLAAGAAQDQAVREGFNALLLTTYLQGEAREVGRVLAALARQLAVHDEPLPRPACLVFGGETTVTLRGEGLGGRNQEAALGAVADLAGLPDTVLVTLATDGGDGPTDAAGAVATGETLARAREAGMAPDAFLARNDAYHFFSPLGDLLRPGPTQTNVNDLAFIFTLSHPA